MAQSPDAVLKIADFGFTKEDVLGLYTPCLTAIYAASDVCMLPAFHLAVPSHGNVTFVRFTRPS